MPRFLTKQPDGKFAIYSTIVSDIVIGDATEEEIIAFRISEKAAEIRTDYEKAFEAIRKGELVPNGYGQFYAGDMNFVPWEDRKKV